MEYTNKILNDGTTLVIGVNGLTLADGVTENIEWAEYQDKSVQVFGNFGAGGAVTVEGSNDGVNFAPLTNAAGGTLLLFTSNSLKQVLEASRYMRLRVTGGDGTTSLNASVFLRRASSIRT
jgi:hypothetical protein